MKNRHILQVSLIIFLSLGFFGFYYFSQKKFIKYSAKEKVFSFLNPSQKKTNILLFSGFFGCSTVCSKNFQIVEQMGNSFPKEELEIIFFNTDPLIESEEFLESCKTIFKERITCIYPSKQDFQNFFRSLGLPIYKTQAGFEHSGKFLLYRHYDKNLFLLENPSVPQIQEILSFQN